MATRSPNRPNWYEILHLSSSGFDPNDVDKRFNMLNCILNPAKNPYPFAAEAHEWVCRAYSVLSDPIRRAQFDNDKGTFWTACPFCYYHYEYENMFLECCLRCHNVKCRRAFTALPVSDKVAPPPFMVKNGNYYYPLHGFSQAVNDKEGGGQTKGSVPVGSSSSIVSPGQNSDRVNENNGDQMGQMTGRANERNRNQKGDTFIEIVSDDENESKGIDDEKEGKGMEFGNRDSKIVEAKEEEVEGKGNNNEGKVKLKRRKMMARTTKKVMGRGVRVDMDVILRREDNDEREDSRMKEDGEGNGGIGCGDAN